jgi:chromate reductase
MFADASTRWQDPDGPAGITHNGFMHPTIVTICGSSQPSSFTGKALAVVTDELRVKGLEVTVFDGAELHLDFPGRSTTDDGRRLRDAVKAAGGVVLATPEYHGTFSAMTKLAIENMGFPSALQGKPVALLGVASGRIGAIKSIEQLRGVCSHVGALVVPNAISIANVRSAFDAAGHITDAGTEQALRGLAAALATFMRDYVCPKFVMEAAVREGTIAAPWTTTV